MSTPAVLSSTPVLFVAAIEPAVDFWQNRLGFSRTIEVPIGDSLGFAAFSNGQVEVMYQTYASGAEDTPDLGAEQRASRCFLFLQVADIDAIAQALDGIEIVMPRRTTFYGATEIGYREPGGHLVTFAQFAAPTAA
jgi:uncharacterized glyoxalase superfamily protein PhnB